MRTPTGARRGLLAENIRSSGSAFMEGSAFRRGQPIRLGALALIIVGAVCTPCRAAAPLILNHDNANRLIEATSSGSGAQFNYDANGNVSSIAAASPATLTLGATQAGQLSTGNAAALFTFTMPPNEPALSLDLISSNMTPAGSPVQVDVYNASGTLIGSTIGGSGTLLNLPLLPAGTYSVSVEAQNGATGSFQMQLMNNSVTGADGPLPLWAYVVLGAAFFTIVIRRERTLGGTV